MNRQTLAGCDQAFRGIGFSTKLTAAAACAVLSLAGCGREGLHLAPVEGTVLVDGKPLGDVGIVFSPVDSTLGPPAVGSTDASGRFTLVTANRLGAVIGEHRVAISKDESLALPQQRGFPVYKLRSHIAPRFGNLETSGLTASVVDDDNDFQFDVASK